jgi:Heavy metal associated domain 2
MTDQCKHTCIVSTTPKRTRIRVSLKRRNLHELERIAKELNESPGIHHITFNANTGTMVINHEDGILDELFSRMRDIGVILMSAADLKIPSADGKTIVCYELTDAVADLNRRLGLATNGLFNLRTLVPLGFGALAFVQLVRRGLELGAAPWYVLAYASFDSFVKLHYSREMPQKSPVHQSEAPGAEIAGSAVSQD